MAAPDKNGMKKRNIEIGRILQQARVARGATASECAALIATGRQRYADIERGESFITVVELEQLMEFLDISREVIWPSSGGAEVREGRVSKIVRLPVVLDPEESMQLIIELVPGE